MSWIISLALISLGSSVAYAVSDVKEHDDALQRVYGIWHDECQFIVGISEEKINSLRNGTPTEDESAQRYVLCLFFASGVLTHNLQIDTYRMKEYMPPHMSNGTQNYLDCLEETKKTGIKVPYIVAWNVIRCVYQKDPKHYFLF